MAMLAAPVTDAPTRDALLDAVRAPVSATLGKPVMLKADRIMREGDWAFVHADMQDRGGKPVDLAGTPLADAAREGMASRSCAALLRKDGGHWQVVEQSVGATDAVWEGWAAKHKAPTDLFRFPSR